jgi:hypothetical protein
VELQVSIKERGSSASASQKTPRTPSSEKPSLFRTVKEFLDATESRLSNSLSLQTDHKNYVIISTPSAASSVNVYACKSGVGRPGHTKKSSSVPYIGIRQPYVLLSPKKSGAEGVEKQVLGRDQNGRFIAHLFVPKTKPKKGKEPRGSVGKLKPAR